MVWQNSSTPDTYYSCSDLILKADSAGAAAPAKNSTKAKPLSTRAPEPGAVAAPADAAGPTTAPGAPAVRESWLTKAEDDERVALGRHVVTAALIVLSGVTAGAAIIRMRRARAAQRSPGAAFEDR